MLEHIRDSGREYARNARDFFIDAVGDLVGDAAQSVIPTTNWMYPANVPAAGLPEGFGTLIQPAKSLLFSSDEAGALREAAVAEWQAALSR